MSDRRPPSGQDVDRLVAELHEQDPVRRAAAIARLRVVGSRAVSRLLTLARSAAPPSARAAALAALEGGDDSRAAEAALETLGDPAAEVAIAALGVLRAWVTREPGARLLDAVTVVALDRTRDATVRAAALESLSDLPRHLVGPILERAAGETDVAPSFADPQAARAWLAAHERDAPLAAIHDVVTAAGEREQTSSGVGRQEWLAVRGAAHASLARRGSRLGVYDLREAFDRAATPLPLDFLTAVTSLGDASCLDPLARAWAAAGSEPWWRERLKEAAADIVRRHRLSRRNAVITRIRSKWAGFLEP